MSEVPVPDPVFSFTQELRKQDLEVGTKTIPLKNIRDDLKLKSTWFNMTPLEDSVLFMGFGFGHGVGLCQEGAMQMAASGYQAEQIIHFYFKGVQLMDYELLSEE